MARSSTDPHEVISLTSETRVEQPKESIDVVLGERAIDRREGCENCLLAVRIPVLAVGKGCLLDFISGRASAGTPKDSPTAYNFAVDSLARGNVTSVEMRSRTDCAIRRGVRTTLSDVVADPLEIVGGVHGPADAHQMVSQFPVPPGLAQSGCSQARTWVTAYSGRAAAL